MAAIIIVAKQLLAGAFVAPAKYHTILFRLRHTFVDNLFVQFGIGGIGDILLLHGAINTHIRILSIFAMLFYGVPKYFFHS